MRTKRERRASLTACSERAGSEARGPELPPEAWGRCGEGGERRFSGYKLCFALSLQAPPPPTHTHRAGCVPRCCPDDQSAA